jgi:RHS repeat-associated protein
MMIPARRATPGSMSALFILVVFGASTSLAEKNHQVANHEKDDPTDWWEGDENAWWDDDANDWWKTDTEGKDEKDEKEEDERKVDAFGAFTDAIPLEVPEFHGIAPELSLTYKSSGVNGWLGVGWTLEGLGLIERASPGKGAPSYDDGSDIFLFDGEELVPCAPGSVSPGCAAGGTHSTRTENYTRIAFTGAGADSRWTITRKDGTEAVYAPVYRVDPGPDGSWGTADDVFYKWGLSQVTDTSGNAVTYSWATDQFGCCWEHPESISYNGAVITFYYEPRPDVELVATGVGLSTLRGRLETIDVTVSGSRVRAYKLSYAASPASERSLLSSVQQFGSDAVVDGSGTVVGGTSLPARAAGYQAGTPGFVAGGTDTGMHSGEFSQFLPMDVNGDGLTDMLEVYRACFVLCANKHAAWISDGSGFTKTSESNIADPQYSRFLVADVNGDGMDDAVELYRNAFLFVYWGRRIWLSNGDGFTNAGTDNDIGVYDEDSRFFAMDINGDGMTDMLELYPSWGSYRRRTWISDGTTFIETSDEPGMHYSDAARFYPIDINGDGKSDLVELFQFSVSWARRVWISHGTGLYEAGTDYSISFDNDKHLIPTDVNGDGKTDMVEIGAGVFGSYQRRVWLSTGVDFTLASSSTGNCLLSESEFLPADINGDGRGDLIELCRLSVGYQRRLWLSGGDDFVAGASDAGLTFISDPQYRTLDVNGDGLTEMVQLHTVPIFGGTARSVWFVGGAHADLLTSLENDAGGTTTVSYEPSSTWENTNNPPIVQTAAEVSVHDGRGNVDTTTYSHAGGLYDRAERRFLGFRYQMETRPCIAGESGCPYRETWLRQDYGAATKPERVDRRDGDGQLLTSTVYEYTTNGATVPWTSLATGRWDYTYINGGASCPGSDCKRTYFARTFNEYGELTQEIDHGDYDEAGDERTRATTFVPNTTAYLVSKPADEKLFDGAGTAGALLNETLRYYDGAASWSQPPSAGLQTKEARWLSNPSSFVETRREYDAWGNVTAEIDELGARSEIEIDPIYHRFPTSKTNPLGQVTTTAWDAGCGVQTRTTDLNGQPTTMTYDPLCRLAETIAPGGKFERHTRVNLGDAATQHELIERPGADGTGDPLWTATYFDGHRRIWRTASKGPDAATGDIYVDTTYNGRSQVATVTEPYYWAAGASQPATYATTLGYDAIDRLTEVTFADGAQLTRSFALWSVTLTDELGRSKTDHKDAHDNRIAHEEIVAGQVETVTYVYDGRGHLTRSIDPHDNVTIYATDSLGRRTQVVDPDWGVWTYEYDAAGRATAHTDPRDQRTTFGYDLLGRKTRKTSLAGTGSAESVSWTYDQPAGGYYNIGKLTTMTDGAGQETFDYDVAGRAVHAVRTIDGTSYAFDHGFDAGDRALWTTYPDGDTLGTPGSPLRYDGAGRLASIPGYVLSARYDATGKLVELDNANGTVTTRRYTAERGWLTQITTSSGPTLVQDLAYARNAKGLITEVASAVANDRWTYQYDELDRLVSAMNPSDSAYDQSFSYDAIGNITWSSRLGEYTYGSHRPHAVTATGSNIYTYDAAGLMTAGAGRTMTWDGDNRLASVTEPGGSTLMTFTYDANGARIQQVEGATTRRYLGDDYEIEVGGATRKYISVGEALVARTEGTTPYWVHVDHLGSIQAETDASGVEVHRKTYRPFGDILSSAGTLEDEPRGYVGQRRDASGLQYLHARYYDPALGRFISPDLVIDGPSTVGLNRYAYSGNDPVNRKDINGLDDDDDEDDEQRAGGNGGGGSWGPGSDLEEHVENKSRSNWVKGLDFLKKGATELCDRFCDRALRSVLKKLPGSGEYMAIESGIKTGNDWASNPDFSNPPCDGLCGTLWRGTGQLVVTVSTGAWNYADSKLLNFPSAFKYLYDGHGGYYFDADSQGREIPSYPLLGTYP